MLADNIYSFEKQSWNGSVIPQNKSNGKQNKQTKNKHSFPISLNKNLSVWGSSDQSKNWPFSWAFLTDEEWEETRLHSLENTTWQSVFLCDDSCLVCITVIATQASEQHGMPGGSGLASALCFLAHCSRGPSQVHSACTNVSSPSVSLHGQSCCAVFWMIVQWIYTFFIVEWL